MESLKVRENGPMSWDFTMSEGGEAARRTILNAPDMGGGNIPMTDHA